MDTTDGMPAHRLHVLVSRLDRIADQRLRESTDLTYQKFLALLRTHELMGSGPVTQRALADEVGLTEAGVSRLVASLRDAGWIDVRREAGSGNRRSLVLTAAGGAQLEAARRLLEGAFETLLARAEVEPAELTDPVGRLLAALDAGLR